MDSWRFPLSMPPPVKMGWFGAYLSAHFVWAFSDGIRIKNVVLFEGNGNLESELYLKWCPVFVGLSDRCGMWLASVFDSYVQKNRKSDSGKLEIGGFVRGKVGFGSLGDVRKGVRIVSDFGLMLRLEPPETQRG
jgi:hypothetical protein